MTEMKRVTFAVPDALDRRILELRKSDEFVRCSYGEIVRRLVAAGIQAVDPNEQDADEQKGA